MESKIHKGDKFGELTVIKDMGIINKSHMYKVKCSCGKSFSVRQNRLLTGATTKCSSCVRNTDFKGRIIDGYLVIRKVGKINNETHLSWECKCLKCGRKMIISSLNLANKDINKIPICKCHSKKPIAKKKKTNNLVGQLF